MFFGKMKELQARYYWNYVLDLEKARERFKRKHKTKVNKRPLNNGFKISCKN